MKRVKNILIPCVALLCLASSAWAQEVVSNYDARFAIQYPVGKSEILANYRENHYAIEELKRFFSTIDISMIDSISIVGSSSPEGGVVNNTIIATKRAESLRNFICTELPYVSRNMMHLYAQGDTWSDMLRAIRRDPQFPNKNYTLIVLGANQTYTERLKLLQFLEYKDSHDYITRTIFPRLRNSTAFLIYYKSTKPFVVHDTPETFEKRPKAIVKSENIPALSVAPVLQEAAPPLKTDTPQASSWTVEPRAKKALFALKTNLLFDAASMLNAEIEIPIGPRWSVAAEWIFPWWLWNNEQYCLQLMSGTIEARYWFEDRTDRKQLTGWFLGAYVSGGLYDLEWKGTGVQGEFLGAAGLSAGFAHTLDKRGTWRMEYSLGVGYMQTKYRQYKAEFGLDNEWHLIHQYSGTYTWIGPTRAKISLVFMIHHGYDKKKGGSR